MSAAIIFGFKKLIISRIPLHGVATNYSTVIWTTSGDGTFSSTTSLNSSYFPGTTDKSSLSVHLTLTVTPMSPCTNAATSTRIITFNPCGVGFPGLSENTFSFSLRPNPSNGHFTIYSSSVKNESAMIRILDLNGKTVRTENCNVSGDNLEVNMDLTYLAKGVYFVRIETKNGVKTEKLVLE